MRIARDLFAVALIAAVGIGATASAASAATPMNVKIAPFAGKKVKVAKRLKVLVSCSQDCAAKVRVTLVSPAGNSTVKGGRGLKASTSWTTGMILTSYGVRILRNHYRNSKLRIAVSARNIETGKISRKTKVFRFRR